MLSRFTLPLLLLFGISAAESQSTDSAQGQTGTLEKMIVASGTVAMDLDLNRLNGAGKESKLVTLSFDVRPDSFFTILVFNKSLRGPEPGSMGLARTNSVVLPEALNVSSNQLTVEKVASDEGVDLAIRDANTGFRFFNVEGHLYSYNSDTRVLGINGGRLLISEDFAKRLGRPADAGSTVGRISINATMAAIQISKVVNGAVESAVMPPVRTNAQNPNVPTFKPGPDVIVGDLPSLQQFGSSGTQVGLAVGTTSCNNGDVELNWFALPNTDHPVIPQNVYRMSGGASNTDRFEQIGQSWLKHAFTALQGTVCSNCTPASNGTHLGVGCSDPYDSSLNASQSGLGSRAWVNPFTGAYPATARNHTGHSHNGTSHRILVEAADLNTTLNPGATYYAEAQYVTPHEYAWCQSHAGQCNMYNNASYRRYNVSGTTSFSFSPVGSTVRQSAAITAWTGATINQIQPAPGTDGVAFIAYKVTNPSAGVWHYEYAVLNQNLDRSIQSFSVPLGCGVTISNPGFHAPLNAPGFAADGTSGDAGYSNAPWTPTQTAESVSWNSQTFAENQNANAIRWGTMYNFRFDSNRPPQAMDATIGYFKTGSPTTVAIQGPAPDSCAPLQVVTAVSRKTHGGAGDFDIGLPMSGEPAVECRNSGGNHTFIFTFTNPVVSGNASVTGGTGAVLGSPSFSGNSMTVNLTGVSDVQKLILTLNGVTDSSAQVLPDTAVSVNMLAGDVNGNKSVNSSDVGQAKSQAGATVTSSNFRSDVNVNGSISASDVGQIKALSGNSVP